MTGVAEAGILHSFTPVFSFSVVDRLMMDRSKVVYVKGRPLAGARKGTPSRLSTLSFPAQFFSFSPKFRLR